MADKDLQNVLNSGALNSIYLGGVTSNDKVIKKIDLTAIEGVLTTKAPIAPMTSFYIGTHRAEQTMTTETWTKLDWTPEDGGESAVSPLISYGTDDIEYDNVGFKIKVKTAGMYKINGTISVDATINDIFSLGIMHDSPSPSEPQWVFNGVGKNTSSQPLPVQSVFTFIAPLVVDDDITMWGRTSGTKLQIHKLSFTIEKLPY